jgi:Predicted methyltransferase (contains TPR repeat)
MSISKGFDQYAAEYDAWFLENPNVLESEARLVASTLKDAGRILSVGCGSGLFEKIMRDEFGIVITDGVEPSAPMAEIARKRGLTVTEATAEEFDYPEGKYDTILFNGCPSYITDLRTVIGKVYKALPKGGRIVLVDVPKESTYGILYNLAKAVGTWNHPLLEGTFPPNPYPIELVKVASWRTTAEKINLLTEAGFTNQAYAQTLTTHPLYSDLRSEDPVEGYDKGDYVAITAWK